MSVPRVSIGQACANALSDYFQSVLSSDITVHPRWVETAKLTKKTVTITKIGKRRRLDVIMPKEALAQTQQTGNSVIMTLPVGSYMQPLQIDVWCTNDFDRDDVLDQLDDALTAGVDRTIGGGLTDDPVRDGILLSIKPDSGWQAYIDCWFDEPDLSDDPDSVQVVRYRATYVGEARGLFARIRQVPLLTAIELKLKASPQSPPPAGQLYETTTITPTGVTHGTSS